MAIPPLISRLQDLRDRAAGALTANQALVWNGTAWTTALLPIAGVDGLQTALDAKAPTTHTHPASQVSDSSAAGRALLTAANVAAQQTALGLATVATSGSASDLGTGTLPAARLPIAAAGTLGGVRVGSGLAIDGSGILSASGLSAGTVSGSGLRWNGSAWVEATNSLNDGTTTTMTQQSITSRALVVRGHVSATTTDAPAFAIQHSTGTEAFSVRDLGGDAAIYLAGQLCIRKVGSTWQVNTLAMQFNNGVLFGDTVTIKNGGGGGSPYFAINCRTAGNLGPVVLGADASDAGSANTDIIDVAKAMRFRAGVQLIQGLPNAAPTDANIRNNCMAVWLDNTSDTLTFRIRKNDGTYITKTL